MAGDANGFVAPHVAALNTDELDFGELLIVGSNVRMRSQPRPDAPIIARLSHEVVLAGLDYGGHLGAFLEADQPAGPSTMGLLLLLKGFHPFLTRAVYVVEMTVTLWFQRARSDACA